MGCTKGAKTESDEITGKIEREKKNCLRSIQGGVCLLSRGKFFSKSHPVDAKEICGLDLITFTEIEGLGDQELLHFREQAVIRTGFISLQEFFYLP